VSVELHPGLLWVSSEVRAAGWRVTSTIRANELTHAAGNAIDVAPPERTGRLGPASARAIAQALRACARLSQAPLPPLEVLGEWDHLHIGISRNGRWRWGWKSAAQEVHDGRTRMTNPRCDPNSIAVQGAFSYVDL
jgi:hypothetical protein